MALAVGFVRAHQDVSTVLLGTSSLEHLERNLGLMAAPPLSVDVIERLRTLVRTGDGDRTAMNDTAMNDATMNDGDVIVIGSGPCGAAAASRLVERGVSVTMLDAGLRAPSGIIVRAAGNTLYRRMGWKYYSTDRLGPGTPPDVDWVSSLSLGGLSNFWTAAVPRFAPEDFTEGGRLDERYVWPIAYEELVPFYELAEGMLQVTAGEAIPGVPSNVRTFEYQLPDDWRDLAERAAGEGHAVGVLPMAKGRPWMIALRGTEFSSYHCVVRPLLSSPRFRLVSGAHVARIRTSGAGGQCRRRGLRRPSQWHVEVGSWPRGGDRRRRDRLHGDRPAIDVTRLPARNRQQCRTGRSLSPRPPSGVVAATRATPLRALSHPVYAARTPHGTGRPAARDVTHARAVCRTERLRTFYGGRTSTFGVQVFGTMVPTPDLGVTSLHRRTTIRFAAGPRSRCATTSRRSTTWSRRATRLRDLFAGRRRADRRAGAVPRAQTWVVGPLRGHLRMHADPAFGVVDAWNRMHDVPNVVVCDSSCFTTGPEKNPTLTAMAIALRAADRLATDLG